MYKNDTKKSNKKQLDGHPSRSRSVVLSLFQKDFQKMFQVYFTATVGQAIWTLKRSATPALPKQTSSPFSSRFHPCCHLIGLFFFSFFFCLFFCLFILVRLAMPAMGWLRLHPTFLLCVFSFSTQQGIVLLACQNLAVDPLNVFAGGAFLVHLL